METTCGVEHHQDHKGCRSDIVSSRIRIKFSIRTFKQSWEAGRQQLYVLANSSISLPFGDTTFRADKIPVSTDRDRKITVLVPLVQLGLIFRPCRFGKLLFGLGVYWCHQNIDICTPPSNGAVIECDKKRQGRVRTHMCRSGTM